MSKVFLRAIVVFLFIFQGMFAFDLGGIINDATKKAFDQINQKTGDALGMCYEPEKVNLNFDPCAALRDLNNLNGDICKNAPNLPGLKKKQHLVGVNGIYNLCKAQDKQFENIVSTVTSNTVENAFKNDELQLNSKLPSGKTYASYLKSWDVSRILQDENTESFRYMVNNKKADLELLMQYSKSSSAKNKDVSELKVNDVKAPKDYTAFKKETFELAKVYSNNNEETSPSAVSFAVANKIKKSPKDAAAISQQHLNSMQMQFDTAKANEIGLELELAKKDDDIIIPTQEYVNILRQDLKSKAILQIRKQQIRDAKIIARVNDKWNRKKQLAQLIANKEVIMAQEFDEAKAREEIERISNAR